MTIGSKEHEYQLMKTSQKRTVEVEIPNGPKTVWLDCWDYRADLHGVTFKTITPPSKYPLGMIKSNYVDLSPVHNFKFWVVQIKRV